MVAPVFQYFVHHPVSGLPLGRLDVRDAVWSEVVSGGTTFTGKVTVPDNPSTIASIRSLTEPKRSALYAVVPDRARLQWGGPLVARKWNSDTNELTITAQDWRSWLYSVILGPSFDGTSVNARSWTSVDQWRIAHEVVEELGSADFNPQGIPYIDLSAMNTPSDIGRTFYLNGLDFKSPAAYLDELATLDRGFEWDLVPYYGPGNNPVLKLQIGFPQQGGVVPGLRFAKTPDGGNILDVEELEYDGTASVTRVWAVGEGPNAESTPWAVDEDPELATGAVLRTDVATTFSGGLTRATLAAYARDQRRQRAPVLSPMVFTVRLDNPDMFSYAKGDRCQVTLRDRFMNIDVKNCRILSREITPSANIAKITVNLSDNTVLEVDKLGIL